MKRLLFLLIVVAAACAVPALAAPTAASAGLSPADLEKLRRAACPILVPTYIPAGYKLQGVKVEIDKRFGNSYDIKYGGPNKSSFTVQMANGGIGDGPDGDPYAFSSPVFGKGTLYHVKPDKGVWSGWMPLPGKKFPVYALSGSSIDPRLAVKVVESMRFLSEKR